MICALNIVHIRMSMLVAVALQVRQRRAAIPSTLKRETLPGFRLQNKISPWPDLVNRARDMAGVLTMAQRGTNKSDAQNANQREHTDEHNHAEHGKHAW